MTRAKLVGAALVALVLVAVAVLGIEPNDAMQLAEGRGLIDGRN